MTEWTEPDPSYTPVDALTDLWDRLNTQDEDFSPREIHPWR